MDNNPDKLIVHHDGVSRSGPSFDVINEAHRQRDFPLSSLGFYVGYHRLIERDGTTRTARKDEEEGAHTIGQNRSSIGICLAGNFDIEDPTPEQIAELGAVLTHYCAKYHIPAKEIYPHRHFANKSCFGSRLPASFAAQVCLDHRRKTLDAEQHDIDLGIL